MHFMPTSKVGASSGTQKLRAEETRCPDSPVIRPIPLLQEPPTICLPGSGISSTQGLHFSTASGHNPHQMCSNNTFDFAEFCEDERPIWVIEFLKKANSEAKSMKCIPVTGLKKCEAANTIWRFLAHGKKAQARNDRRRHFQ